MNDGLSNDSHGQTEIFFWHFAGRAMRKARKLSAMLLSGSEIETWICRVPNRELTATSTFSILNMPILTVIRREVWRETPLTNTGDMIRLAVWFWIMDEWRDLINVYVFVLHVYVGLCLNTRMTYKIMLRSQHWVLQKYNKVQIFISDSITLN